jgi:hypothetical protein
VLILKVDKVLCFHTLLQVQILKGLRARSSHVFRMRGVEGAIPGVLWQECGSGRKESGYPAAYELRMTQRVRKLLKMGKLIAVHGMQTREFREGSGGACRVVSKPTQTIIPNRNR